MAQRHAGGARGGGEEDLGRSRGGLTTIIGRADDPSAQQRGPKGPRGIHVAVDALGRPLCFLLTPGQAADCPQALVLPEGIAFKRLTGDRGYDTDAIRLDSAAVQRCAAHGVEAVIPSKRNRKMPIPHDREACKGRHKVENLFGRIKDLGRIVLRKCKTSRSYAGFVSLGLTLVNVQLCP
jgi:transposase